MTDETTPFAETGNPFFDGVLFAVVTAVAIGATLVGYHALNEMLRRKDREPAGEVER